MRDLKLGDFALGNAYRVQGEGGPYAMILIEAQELNGTYRSAGAFRLEFRGPFEPILDQAIYRFDGSDGESDEIFIVAIGREAEGTRYEAVFL